MANDIRIVTEAELRQAVGLNGETVDVVEHAFRALAAGGVVMPPIMSLDLDMVNADVDVKSAYLPGFEGFAVKMSTGFFDNPKLGLPSLNGLMVLFSATTGLVRAVLLDNGYLTDLRTAAAGAVAARHLAPEVVETAGVIGAGVQARLQIEAAYLERKFRRVLVWGRDAGRAQRCADDLAATLGIEVRRVENPADLVRDCQLVVTTTSAKVPLIRAEWLHPGLHITAMGSDTPGKNEIAAEALAKADLYVADNAGQCRILGELRSAVEAGMWRDKPVAELGRVILGQVPGRQGDGDITIADLTGTGAQDTAIATYADEVVTRHHVGTVISA
jgi:ornithine cyclodeaminase